MFVGTLTGKLFHFKLDENRTSLALDGNIIDNVLYETEDMESFTFAAGFGIIPDVTVGPDEYLNVVGGTKTPEGTIYLILPADD
jgi:aldose sugar dehydrogenase